MIATTVSVFLAVYLIAVLNQIHANPSPTSPHAFTSSRKQIKDSESKRRKHVTGAKKFIQKRLTIRSTTFGTEGKLSSSSLSKVASAGLTRLANRSLKAFRTSDTFKRRFKSYFSSDFEQLILKLTDPTDEKPSKLDLLRFVTTLSSFVKNIDTTSKSNPYRVTLRKLWSKLVEKDGRTVLKSLYLFHLIQSAAAPVDGVIFKTLFNKMSRERWRKSRSNYFSVERIRNLEDKHQHLVSFVSRYYSYGRLRLQLFTSSFEEFQSIKHGAMKEDVCLVLLKAEKLISAALQCQLQPLEECAVTTICLELVAKDLQMLSSLYAQKVRWLLKEFQIGDFFEGWENSEVEPLLEHFIGFYNDHLPAIHHFISETNNILELYDEKISANVFDLMAIELAVTSIGPSHDKRFCKLLDQLSRRLVPLDMTERSREGTK